MPLTMVSELSEHELAHLKFELGLTISLSVFIIITLSLQLFYHPSASLSSFPIYTLSSSSFAILSSPPLTLPVKIFIYNL